MSTAQEILEKGRALLKSLEEGELEARFLLLEAASLSEEELVAHPELKLPGDQQSRYFEWIEKRLTGIPLAYLTGHKEFWSLSFNVKSGVLIPRPETELIIERVLELINKTRGKSIDNGDGLLLADIGTGSGNIAVSLARELPKALIHATEISTVALDCAQQNAKAHDVRSIEFHAGDLFQPLLEEGLLGQFDFIVSNPPYIPEKEWEELAPDIRDYEPREALAAGEAGLDVIDRLIRGAGRFLKPGGYLVFEIGFGQKQQVLDLFAEGWGRIFCFDDLAGIPRIVSARRL